MVRLLAIKSAKENDIDRIDKLYNGCISELNNSKIFQWDESYPNIDTYKKSIEERTQYIFLNNDILIGAVILNESQAKEWDGVPWNHTDKKSLIIHALAISREVQGKGYGQRVLELCEKYGIENGYSVIRLDVFSENQVAIGLYERNGYKRVGKVSFGFKLVGHQVYYCYEKNIVKE